MAASYSYTENNHEQQNDLKKHHDLLMSQLQLGVTKLKSMVSKPPDSNKSYHDEIIGIELEKSRAHSSCKNNVGNMKRRSTKSFSRSTSTPKVNPENHVSARKKNLSRNMHSFLISDAGNIRPASRGRKFDANINSNSSNNKKLPLHSDKKSPHCKSKRVCFSPTLDKKRVSENEKVDKSMMGYDWIAGMLDNNSLIGDRSNKFFEGLKEFRKSNWNECKSSKAIDSSTCETSYLSPALKQVEKENYPLCCTGNGAYMLNNRLNLIPIHGPYSGCPVCKIKPQSEYDDDGYVRVSIPRSTLKSPYQLRPHRRKSFDPSDSVALSMHCLAGWQASKPSCIPGPTNVDLASHSSKTGLTSVKSLKGVGYKC